MSNHPYSANQGIFSLALASRGLAPTHIKPYEPVEAKAPATPSLAGRLVLLSVALMTAAGVFAASPGA
jgi:hypothetical protein